MSPERILVLRLSSLGDVVLTSSFLRSVRACFPDAQIDFVVRADLAPLATALPHVERVIAVPRGAGLPTLLSLGAQLARGRYAHVFDVHQSLRTRLLTLGLWRRLRRGFHKQSVARWALLHLRHDIYTRTGGARSLRQRMLAPLQRLDFAVQPLETQLRVSSAAREQATQVLTEAELGQDGAWIALAPGARWASKQWPTERYAELLRRLAAQTDARFAVVGAPAEAAITRRVCAALPERCLDLAERLDVLETAAVLERCRFLVCNDSGLLHVAEAVGRPVVAFFGPTVPEFGYAPYRSDSVRLQRAPACSPCSKNGSRACHRSTHECMLNISVEEAVSAALALWQRTTVDALS